MKDGIIELDSPRGQLLDFTSDRFDGYLWKMEDVIVISFIESKKRGNFRELVAMIHSLGFAVQVPTPLGRMQEIVEKNGYVHSTQAAVSVENGDDLGLVHLWTLKPAKLKTQGLDTAAPQT